MNDWDCICGRKISSEVKACIDGRLISDHEAKGRFRAAYILGRLGWWPFILNGGAIAEASRRQ
jgi:hypothetical protein